ncbi:UDP-N-acetylmuramoylalanine--D-glutamate ligase [Aureimonas sp. Leaf454]|uniref:UDP-N-acetylmuramoyl-L-alanine--D-glutamate ligase n=1 Tax=Aureimonas sp. Leaf454 TaxID=1736381 RepID=UPI0006F41D9B|nr:UDP-N-acetylmuramoyl-L-alanine--D-glutamate ligase [Aureimonas sp. Leaf454]KQT50904.1 UDP-N-acetylmuramoylalanine--D-glutamate ligase [Aureimonas sp. Leaf454]
MIDVSTLAGQCVALFGLGGSGRATALALKAGGAKVVAFDDNPASIEAAKSDGIAIADLHGIDWSRQAALILSPGVPLTHPRPHWTADLATAAGVPIIGDVELFSRERAARAPDAPFIAITGTNGKSTTTALIAHCLRSAGRDTQLGGNIGVAVLTLDAPTPDRFYVVECSSYQIDLAPSIAPSVAILLNLTPDHLDRHGTMEHYAAVKARLLEKAGMSVVGVDDEHCRAIAEGLEARGRPVTRISQKTELADGVFFDGTSVVAAGKTLRSAFDLTGIGSLRGRHNGQNAAAAVAALLASGLTHAEVETGLRSFPGLAHRMEEVGRIGRTLFVNDSKATNAEAAAPALGSFRDIRWIVGGLPKEGGISSLAPLFPRVAKAYLIGEAAPAFAATLGDRVPFEISGTLDIAVANAARDAAAAVESEPVVLLSPACASFDQFRNFEVRGAAFRDAVARLPGIELFRKGEA